MSAPRSLRAGLLAMLLLPACDPAPPPAPLTQVLELQVEAGAGLDLSRLRWAPAGALRPLSGALPGRRLLQVEPGHEGSILRLELPGACPEQLKLGPPGTARLSPVRLRGRHGAANTRWPLGAGPGRGVFFPDVCPEKDAGQLEWKQLSGPPRTPRISERGRRLQVDLPGWPRIPEGADGVLPLSPAGLPTVVFQGRFTDLTGAYERLLQLDILPRATGFPAIATGQRVVLAEGGLTLEQAPRRGEVAFVPEDPAAGRPATFQPMAPGRYFFRRPDGSQLQLSARRHDHTRMDCARAECHPRESAAYARTAMATIGRRGLEGELGAAFDPRCAVACHGTSEPGLPDGGVLHVARELDFALPARGAPGSWDALPRDLRRVAGIGCTPCHGPGSLPEHRASWVILRSQVCATCHDAPPNYPRVRVWQQGAMSRSDRLPETRAPGCARCHSTGGFLQAIGHLSRPVVPEGEAQPGPAGIACAACHAAHRDDAGAFGLRQPPIPAHLPVLDPPEAIRVCLPCHASGPSAGPPRSTVAEIFLGERGGPEVENPHLEVEGSCLGCHTGHDFSVNPATCQGCHEGAVPPDPSKALRKEAAALLGQSLPAGRGHLPWRLGADPAKIRAYRQAGLVAADRAVGIHGAPRARALLEAARAVLDPDP